MKKTDALRDIKDIELLVYDFLRRAAMEQYPASVMQDAANALDRVQSLSRSIKAYVKDDAKADDAASRLIV